MGELCGPVVEIILQSQIFFLGTLVVCFVGDIYYQQMSLISIDFLQGCNRYFQKDFSKNYHSRAVLFKHGQILYPS